MPPVPDFSQNGQRDNPYDYIGSAAFSGAFPITSNFIWCMAWVDKPLDEIEMETKKIEES
jgi:hypothetical protein